MALDVEEDENDRSLAGQSGEEYSYNASDSEEEDTSDQAGPSGEHKWQLGALMTL